MNITDILNHYNLPFLEGGSGHQHARRGWIQVEFSPCCGVRHYRLGWNLRGKYWSCWQCGKQPLVVTLQALTGVPWPTARELATSLLEGSYSLPEAKERPPGKLVIPKGVGPLLPAHRAYLKGRGFNPEEIASLWGVGGIGMAGKLSWRLFIPIHLEGQVVSWTTRAVGSTSMRYITASSEQEKVPAKSLLYGEDYARHAIAIVEGPVDVWKIGPGAVATMGTGYSRAQLLRMSRFPVRYVALDAEPAAQKKARILCAELETLAGRTYNVIMGTGKDPSRASEDEVTELRRLLK